MGGKRLTAKGLVPKASGLCRVLLALILSLALLPGCSGGTAVDTDSGSGSPAVERTDGSGSSVRGEVSKDDDDTDAPVDDGEPSAALDLSSIPAYSGSASVQVLDNVPQFTDADRARGGFEEYSDVDSLGRCGVAFALVGAETMPTEERGSIGMVKPSGWHTVRYDGLVDGNYLYNRCHLIGYQLAGENANVKNLITGTRYLNVEGMLPYENQVADYVERTGNHVLYRVTPVFEGENLVASGVQMEAWSVEDEGTGVSFDVYCYNVQPGISIDYATGGSSLAGDGSSAAAAQTEESSAAATSDQVSSSQETDRSYVLNTNTKKFHFDGCRALSRMKASNREDFTGTWQSLLDRGYSPCAICNP